MRELSQLSLCFDLDGTIVDTAPDLVRVLNLVIAEEGLNETHYETARKEVGFGARQLIIRACERANHNISQQRLDELWHLFLNLYENNIAQYSQPFPGVIETLKKLKSYNCRLSVCTNKPGYLARSLLNKLGMVTLFERIIGSGDGVAHKPAAAHIFAAAGHKNRNNIVMIGDSIPDVAAARAARVPCIIMQYGYAGTLTDRLRANITLRQFRELPAALFSLKRPNEPF